MSFIRSPFMYAAPIWFPNTSTSLIQKLQNIQNSALLIANGSVKMTFIDHLHEETKMFLAHDHLSLVSSEYLAWALLPNRPYHTVVISPSGIRDKKKTFQSRFLYHVDP